MIFLHFKAMIKVSNSGIGTRLGNGVTVAGSKLKVVNFQKSLAIPLKLNYICVSAILILSFHDC